MNRIILDEHAEPFIPQPQPLRRNGMPPYPFPPQQETPIHLGGDGWLETLFRWFGL